MGTEQIVASCPEAWLMYDQLAPHFRDISLRRKTWIESINEFISQRLNPNDRLLDIGAGDGMRVRSIADAAGVKEIVLIEPSKEMCRLARNTPNSITHNISAENLLVIQDQGSYDAILCLWNVLGHIPAFEKRVLAVRNMVELLDHDGFLCIDVSNRYNSREYGDKAKRSIALDKQNPGGLTGENGDFVYQISVGDHVIPASGHSFTENELRLIVTEAGAQIVEVVYFDYETGEQVNSQFEGQILMILGKSSDNNSSS